MGLEKVGEWCIYGEEVGFGGNERVGRRMSVEERVVTGGEVSWAPIYKKVWYEHRV